MENSLACRSDSYGRFQSIAYEHLAELGVRYVEIALPPPDRISDTLAELERYGLSASSIHAGLALKNPGIGSEYVRVARAARELGAQNIFVSATMGELGPATAYGRLREVGDACAEEDVTLVLETHPDLVTNGDTARRTMENVGHPNVRVNWDTANVHYYNEGIDEISELTTVLEYVGGVHLKDTNGGYHTHHFPPIGQGVVDYPAVFRVLNESGFYGPFTIELEGIEGVVLDEDGTKAMFAESVAYLRGIGVV